MNINSVGEFGLIDLIKQGTIVDPEGVEIGIGDDAAAFWPAPGRLQLLTADMLVETIHFERKWISPWQLGYKALAVNISDIAAMGGKPRQAAVSLALPRECPVEFVLELYNGMKAIGQEYGVNIIGGDTVSSPDNIIINVALTGDVAKQQLVRRSGAKPGDVVIVTGCLGNSAAGLAWLLAGGQAGRYDGLVSAHVTPKPQVAAGQAAGAAGATAMDDISDGLASEANEIAAASNAGIIIYEEKLPISQELSQFAVEHKRDPLEYVLYGGEDYQLLITLPEVSVRKMIDNGNPFSCTVIGEVVKDRAVVLSAKDGSQRPLEPQGYNHFR